MRNRYPNYVVHIDAAGTERVLKLYGGATYKNLDGYAQRNLVEWANKGAEMVAELDEIKAKEKAKRSAAREKRKVVTP